MARRQMSMPHSRLSCRPSAQPCALSKILHHLSVAFTRRQSQPMRPPMHSSRAFSIQDQDPISLCKHSEQDKRVADPGQAPTKITAHLALGQTSGERRTRGHGGTRGRGQTTRHGRSHAQDEGILVRIEGQHQALGQGGASESKSLGGKSCKPGRGFPTKLTCPLGVKAFLRTQTLPQVKAPHSGLIGVHANHGLRSHSLPNRQSRAPGPLPHRL